MQSWKVLAVAAAFSAVTARSYANTGAWSVNAAACIADSQSIQNNLYMGTAGTIKFADGKIGHIVLYCGIGVDLGFTPHSVALTHYDDSSAAGNHVTAQLIRMELGTGLISILGTADSDRAQISTNGNAKTAGSRAISHNYEPRRFAYYLRIDAVRSSPTANEVAYSVAVFP